MNSRLRLPLVLAVLAPVAAAQWHLATPLTSPQPRAFPGMAYDLMHGQTVLFGGAKLVGFGSHADTWIHDGTDWILQTPLVSPTARPGVTLVYDLIRGKTVLYGGTNGSPMGGSSLQDTWEWDGTNWAQISTTSSMGRRGRYAAAFDLLHAKTVLYGGVPSTMLPGALDGTWEYSGSTWTQVMTATNPGPLQDASMCFDALHNRIVMFGGLDPNTGGNDTTWSYDGVNWTVVPVAGPRPSPRSTAGMVWDSLRNVCVLHGGADINGVMLNDTWTFNGTSWTQLFGAAPASPQSGFGFAFDQARGVGLSFGGANGFTPVTDTFEYDGALVSAFGNGCAGTNGTPVLSATAGPRLGSQFITSLTSLHTGMPLAAMVVGFSSTSYNAIPLPIDAGPLGMPGCTIYLSLDIFELTASAAGTAGYSVTVPADPYFLGLEFFQQGASFDTVNAFGAVLSNAIRATVGK